MMIRGKQNEHSCFVDAEEIRSRDVLDNRCYSRDSALSRVAKRRALRSG